MTQPEHPNQDASPAAERCWSTIGVQGDESCAELATAIHCRNCEAYSNAATMLLERDQPPGYFEERTRYFGQTPADDTSGSGEAVAIFRIGQEWFGLPSGVLTEVAPMRPIHALPHRRGGLVLGLANIRGTLIVCVALNKLLALNETPAPAQAGTPNAQQRLLVIEGGRGRLAFPVDEAHGIHHFRPRDLLAVPETLARATGSFSSAVLPWRDVTVALLEAARTIDALERGLA